MSGRPQGAREPPQLKYFPPSEAVFVLFPHVAFTHQAYPPVSASIPQTPPTSYIPLLLSLRVLLHPTSLLTLPVVFYLLLFLPSVSSIPPSPLL